MLKPATMSAARRLELAQEPVIDERDEQAERVLGELRQQVVGYRSMLAAIHERQSLQLARTRLKQAEAALARLEALGYGVIEVVTAPRSIPSKRTSKSRSVSTATPHLPTSPADISWSES